MHRRTLLTGLLAASLGGERAVAASAGAFVRRVLVGPDEKPSALVDHAGGKRLVVVTMKGHWCQVCLGQLRRLGDQRDRLARLETRVVGVDADSPKANREAAAAVSIPFPILSDRKHQVLDALGLWRSDAAQPMPAIVVFDECGAERGRLVGRRPGQRVERELFALLSRIDAAPPRCEGTANA